MIDQAAIPQEIIFPELLSVGEYAKRVKLSRWYIFSLLKQKRIPQAIPVIGGSNNHFVIPAGTPLPGHKSRGQNGRIIVIPDGYVRLKEWANANGKSIGGVHRYLRAGRISEIKIVDNVRIVPINLPWPARRKWDRMGKRAINFARKKIGLEPL